MQDNNLYQLVEGFDMLGEFLAFLFQSEQSMYFLVLVIFAVMFKYLLTGLMKKLPMFEGSGDRDLNTSGSVVAWCISLLSVMAIGWQTREMGMGAFVTAMVGPYGVFMAVVLGLMLGYGIWKNLDGYRAGVRRMWAILGGALVYFWMLGFIINDTGLLGLFIVLTLLGFAAAGLTHLFGKE